jgi:hypothetical protein
MDQRKEQRVCIKVCASIGKTATEALTVIQQAFGYQILSCMQVFQWHALFETGHTSVDYDEHTGRPISCTTPETVAQIQELVHQDRCRTILGSTAMFRGDCVKTCEGVTPDFSEDRPGCFTMTMSCLTLPSSPSSLWWKTKWLSSHTHLTPLIWHPMTCSCFQKLIEAKSQRVLDISISPKYFGYSPRVSYNAFTVSCGCDINDL